MCEFVNRARNPCRTAAQSQWEHAIAAKLRGSERHSQRYTTHRKDGPLMKLSHVRLGWFVCSAACILSFTHSIQAEPHDNPPSALLNAIDRYWKEDIQSEMQHSGAILGFRPEDRIEDAMISEPFKIYELDQVLTDSIARRKNLDADMVSRISVGTSWNCLLYFKGVPRYLYRFGLVEGKYLPCGLDRDEQLIEALDHYLRTYARKDVIFLRVLGAPMLYVKKLAEKTPSLYRTDLQLIRKEDLRKDGVAFDRLYERKRTIDETIGEIRRPNHTTPK